MKVVFGILLLLFVANATTNDRVIETINISSDSHYTISIQVLCINEYVFYRDVNSRNTTLIQVFEKNSNSYTSMPVLCRNYKGRL